MAIVRTQLTGLIAATFTPMRADGSLNLSLVPAMVRHLKDAGVTGLYLCGSTGEGMSLSTAERMELTEAFVDACQGELSLIAHVGHNSIAEAKQLARHAAKAGVDVVSATAPSYYKISRCETLVDTMTDIAAAAPDVPFYYYHIPSLTGSTISMTAFMEMAGGKIPNLAGLKYTAPMIHEFHALQSCCDGRFDVVWGTDEMLLSALAVGAKGAIGSTYNCKAPLDRKIIKAFDGNDLEAARELQLEAIKFIEIVLSYPFHAAMKSVLTRQGVECGPCRLPLENLTSEQENRLHAELDDARISNWLFNTPQKSQPGDAQSVALAGKQQLLAQD
nr:dihydrodipicolinate synthase family protein [Aeoliella straminimaris]